MSICALFELRQIFGLLHVVESALSEASLFRKNKNL